MGAPAFLVDNFFIITQYASHVVTAEEEPAGFEAFRAADGRRSSLDYATATTANSDWWLKVDCGVARSATCVALDRGHNLFGKTVRVQWSTDDFAVSVNDLVNGVLPTAVGVDASLDAALGVHTEEDAWLKRFASQSARYWRIFVPAMGAGLKPQVVGLWVGLTYEPGFVNFPVQEDQDELVVAQTESEAGWLGRGFATPRRTGTIHLKLTTTAAYDTARTHLQKNFGKGRPMWFVPDDAKTERAVLTIRPREPLGFTRDLGWFYPQASIAWQEHEPERP